MKNCGFKSILLIALGTLSIGLIFLAGGCTRPGVFIPYTIQLEPLPITITADQLYAEYMADEAAADAQYKDKEVWFTKAIVDSYVQSPSENYITISTKPQLVIRYFHGFIFSKKEVPKIFITVCSSEKLQKGNVVEIVGECQGMSEGVVTVKINWVVKSGEAITLAAGGY